MDGAIYLFFGIIVWIVYRCYRSPLFLTLCCVIAIIIGMFTDPDVLLTVAVLAAAWIVLGPIFLLIRHLNNKDKIDKETLDKETNR